MVILIGISLVMNDVEHLCMYWLAICVSLEKKCLFRPFAHFLNQIICFSFLLFICIISYIFWTLIFHQIYDL